MSAPSIRGTNVLVVGAGPSGLVLAPWFSRLGVRVRIVHKAAGPGTTSRALAVQARRADPARRARTVSSYLDVRKLMPHTPS